MTPLLSWLLLLVVLGAITLLAMVLGHVDELPAEPKGWRPLEEESTRVTIKRAPYDHEREDQP